MRFYYDVETSRETERATSEVPNTISELHNSDFQVRRRPRLNWNCGRADVQSSRRGTSEILFSNFRRKMCVRPQRSLHGRALNYHAHLHQLRNYLTGLEYFRFMFRCRVQIGRFKLPARLYDLQTKILMILYYTPNSTGYLLLVLLYPWSLSRESTKVPMRNSLNKF